MKILTGDGGGVFGISVARLLEDKDVDTFDAYGGTSIDSAIMSWLALGNSPKVILPILKEAFPKIFSRSCISSFSPFGPTWPNAELTKFAKKNFDVKFSEVKKPMTIVSLDFANRRPCIYCSCDPQFADLPLWQLVLDSTAAPTYFNPQGDKVDGGLFCNNPSLLTTAEMCKHWKASKSRGFEEQNNLGFLNVELLSVGTGKYDRPPIDMTNARYWTALQWAPKIISTMLEGSCELGWHIVAEQLPYKKYARFNKVRLDSKWQMDDPAIIDDLIEATDEVKPEFDSLWKEFQSS